MDVAAVIRTQEPGFDEVVSKASTLLSASGGGALCVYVGGRAVVDMWAGFKDPTGKIPWESDTMAVSWSTTKGVASTALHILADRSQLGYEDRIADYWPEFGRQGKAQITIRELMSMQAGLFDVRHLIDTPELLLDHDEMATRLAAATPRHTPGTASAYHAFTYGWLVAELVKRITGVSIGTFVQSEMVEPLGLDGFYIGTPQNQLDRVAAFPHLPPDNDVVRLVAKAANPITSLFGLSPERIASAFAPVGGYKVMPTDAFLQAEVPSINGVFTARSLARFYAALGSDDGIGGVQLWSPQTRAQATAPQNNRRDLVIPIRLAWQLGYYQPFPRKKTSPSSFGFYGAFGSGAWADPERELAVALICQQSKGLPLNKLGGPILDAIDKYAAT